MWRVWHTMKALDKLTMPREGNLYDNAMAKSFFKEAS
jgi:hypothetical protein